MHKLPLTRATARAFLLLGGVAAAVAGTAAVTDTKAALTDQTNAKLMAISSQNFFPTPLTTTVTCTTNPNGANLVQRRAQISWSAVPGATGYRLELVSKSNGQVKQTYDISAPTTSQGGIVDSGREGLYARVFTKNGEATSSGYTVSNQGMSFKDWVSSRTECEGGTGTNKPNQAWENSATWSGAPEADIPENNAIVGNDTVIERMAREPDAEADPDKQAEELTDSTTETPEPTEVPEPSETEKPEPSETPSETPSATSTPPSESSPSSKAPAEGTEAEGDEPKVTIGIKADGKDRQLGIFHDGGDEPVCALPLEPGDNPTVGNNEVTIVNGGSVTEVDTDTCATN